MNTKNNHIKYIIPKLKDKRILKEKNKTKRAFFTSAKKYKSNLFKISFLLILIIIIYYANNYIYKNNNKFFFFEKNQDELKYCTNYGLMIYNYHYYQNIGDYIQSLAALQYLPKNCKPYLVDRNRIQYYNGPNVKLIMNSWNKIVGGTKYISDKINPIFLSYHINKPKILPRIYLQDLENYAPIGCRDTHTRDKLIKYGIKAYFSSCLTTTLDIDYAAKKRERTNDIIFTDFKFGFYSQADDYIRSLKSYNFNNITNITHYFKKKLSEIGRFKLAKKLLDKYARAKLVITTRLHVSLPCLALNTPVILVNKKFDIRFSGLYKFLNTIGRNEENKFEIKVNVDNKGFVYNSKEYLKYSIKLKEALKNF